ncbi:1-aminocyclopropane-1-carboxylate deaminase/D-cysteine desulfhydrase [Cellvibrio sp. OA-2007]|uniref:1-aminocyclopropane-1-carboxylate deaminase/D-cysteine desulfhydrase n=1 Tax=Cellvibrio sp. OA-2007 TaxID=529823 RepID=UPI000B11F700|nr:pyridoxal-phosphate dependent enzyme [Cellvibrio sp. OA-2007]
MLIEPVEVLLDVDFARANLLDIAVKVPLQRVETKALTAAGIELLVRRDDLIDPVLSGNKFYKLFFNLQAAQVQGFTRVLSFGGAYSNHLHALAAAGKRYGFSTLGVVRGERPAHLSPTLSDAEAWGMTLIFIGRTEYRNKTEQALIADLKTRYGEFYLIPEGGANLAGAHGVLLLGQALEQQLKGDYTAVCIACGTGTSLAGLAAGIDAGKPALGFSVLKGEGGLGRDVNAIYNLLCTEQAPNWRLISGFHCGGYGKKHPDYLAQFWRDFERESCIPLDPVYTVKMFFGLNALVRQGYWPRGSRIVAIHSGGLQGRRGFKGGF